MVINARAKELVVNKNCKQDIVQIYQCQYNLMQKIVVFGERKDGS